MFGSGTTTLIISNKETNDIMKIIKSFEEPGLLIRGLSQTIKNEEKRTKRRISQNVISHFNPIQDEGSRNPPPPLPVFPL